MDRKTLVIISSILAAILILGIILLLCLTQVEKIKEEIKVCKSHGYDGVRFTSGFSLETECGYIEDSRFSIRLGGN
ncbi:unnamed protein product [marine sediment metagenome]|uniref:Uncharacterized protein n=1 Tax=marine sediment metagenome TaxID=412755 RepID=X0V1S0_9ZZZZ